MVALEALVVEVAEESAAVAVATVATALPVQRRKMWVMQAQLPRVALLTLSTLPALAA